ncbi:MAG: epoxide hydrolase family protein [Spongiibacteraceae bacterium]
MQKFQVQWDKDAVADIIQKVKNCKLPNIGEGFGWALGCDRDFLCQLQTYWVEKFDWQAATETLNRFPQYTTNIDGMDIHFVHVVGEAMGKRPLLITHGWPGSHFEFWNIIEPLAYPTRFGGKAEDAFDLVIPSLPGFGFSGKPSGPFGQRQTAAIFNQLMTKVLNYPRYLAQGGDFGSIVTSWLGKDFSDNVKAIHLNMLPLRNMAPPQNKEESDWMQTAMQSQQRYGAYAQLHMTKPMSLVWATADNPLGQAAWITERFHDWSDLTERDFTELYSFDELLTNIMIYLMTDSFASALFFYVGLAQEGGALLPEGERVETPTSYAAFHRDAVLPSAPRSRAELTYNITRWTTPQNGGHFAALEQPRWLIEDIQDWARNL